MIPATKFWYIDCTESEESRNERHIKCDGVKILDAMDKDLALDVCLAHNATILPIP